MNETQGCLKSEQLRRLMECELAAADVAEAEEHLSVCDHCRAMLDRAIGNSDWWQEARESLSPRDCDRSVADEAKSANSDVLALLGPTDDPHMLGRIGTYEIIGILGRGGMGVVFKGFDGALNRYVAIKMLLPHLAASGAARKRFAREAQAAAAVVHDHVMAIHNVAEWQGVPYLVMPYGRGVSLQRRLSDNGPLEVREILRIGMQTAAGLAAAHAQGLVHRDVKPANILLDDGVERVTLTDFGLARAVDDASLTRIGVLAGTPQYMSPEQARANVVDARSDLFSLGSVLYAMCTGRSPFRADSSYGVLRLITDDEPTPIREINPEIPEWLCAIVSRLMAKQPEDRFSSANEVAELLESCLAHVQQPTAVALPSWVSQSRGVSVFGSYKQLFAGVLVMVLTLALGVVVVLAWQGTAPPDITGEWTGEDWGSVVLEARRPGQYEGSYKADHAKSGILQLKWSRVERRFNGTWEEGDERSGKISLRLVGNEIRGAWTTGKNSPKTSGTARLADLLWKRSSDNIAKNADLELMVDKELQYRTKADPEWRPVPRAGVSKLLRDGQTIVIHAKENVPYERVQEIVNSASQRLDVTVTVVRKDSAVTVISKPVAATGDTLTPGTKIPEMSSTPSPQFAGNAMRGKIRLVDTERKVAWINLGAAHSVKPGTRFEVRANTPEDAKDHVPVVKGSVEVTRILDEHLSEVRILKDDAENKLTANDDVIGIDKAQASNSAGVHKADAKVNLPKQGAAQGRPDRTPRRVLQFHTRGSVRTIAYSTDGKLIAVVNGTHALPPGDKEGRSLTDIAANGSKPTFPSSDDWKASVTIHRGMTTKLGRDTETGMPVVSFQVTTDDEYSLLATTKRFPEFEVGAIAFSLDGNVVAVGTSAGQVKLFNPLTGELIRSLNDEPEKLADTQTPEKLKSLSRAMGSVASLAFSPDGNLLAMCGRSIADVPLVPDAISGSPRSVTAPGRLKVWDVKTGTLQHDLVGHSDVNAVVFSSGGDLLASAGSWENIRELGTGVIIWNPRNGTKVRSITNDANGGTRSVAFSPDSQLVAIGSHRFDKDVGTSTGVVSVADVGSGILEWQQTVPGWGKPVAFMPDGKCVAVLCGGPSIRFLDSVTGTVKHEIQSADISPGGHWIGFAISHRGPSLAVGVVDKEWNGSVELWDFAGRAAAKSASDAGTDSLEGVWELALPPEIAEKRPEGLRLRLVFSGDWYGTFRGSQFVSASRFKVEPQHSPKRLSFVDPIMFGEVEAQPMRGIYEVTGDGLRLRVAVDTLALPTKFGTEHPEFQRVKGKLAQELVEALKLYSKKSTKTDAAKHETVDAEMERFQGTWVLVSSESNGEAKSEAKNPYVITFKGTDWKVHREDEVALEGTLQLVDVTSSPRKLDLLKPKGLGPVPTVDYGIYEWKNDTLQYCVRNGPVNNALPGMTDWTELRPKEFETRNGDGRILYLWKRAEIVGPLQGAGVNRYYQLPKSKAPALNPPKN